MSNIILYKPLLKELDFRQKLMSDEKTMAYNHAYGGTIPFPKECWSEWYKKWIEDTSGKRFYRYIWSIEQTQFVGDVAYHYDENRGCYMCDVVICDEYRGKGFGRQGLLFLCNEAKRRNVPCLYDDIAGDNSSIELFFKAGFVETARNHKYITVKKTL